jgi:RND superfamily putative drug exporter
MSSNSSITLSPLARAVRASARAAARRPRTTILLWLALIAACTVAGGLAGMRTLSNAGSGTGESARADARLAAAGLTAPAVENVLIRSASRPRTMDTAAVLEAHARRLSTVRSVTGPPRAQSLARDGGPPRSFRSL